MKPSPQQSVYSLFTFTLTVTIILEIAPANDFSPVFKAAHYSFSVAGTSRVKRFLTSMMLKHTQGNSYQISNEWPMEGAHELTKHKQVREQCGGPDLQRSSFSLVMLSGHYPDGSSKPLLKFDVRFRIFVMANTYNNFIPLLSHSALN